MPIVEKTYWGREFMWPNETAYEGGHQGWVSRMAVADPEEAIALAANELDVPRERIQLRPVLMREIGEVECRIKGFEEDAAWVECTSRARRYEPMWRVELIPLEMKGKGLNDG